MNDPRGRQAGFNAESRDQWVGFSGHREKVSALLGVGSEPGGKRLCVLGAGNGNDLDLPALLKTYREVHLVDLDPEALAAGSEGQGVADHPGLFRFGGVDLTGMLGPIARWGPETPIGSEDQAALVEAPGRLVAPAIAGPYDLVASTCLLSQLISNAHHSVGEAHPQFMAMVQAIRAGHLRLLTQLVATGGTAVLVTDVVSSETFPTLGTLPESSLPGLIPRLIRDRNFFHGVNPAVILSVFKQDPVIQSRVVGLEPVSPWRWSLHGRVYLVVALRYRVV